MSALKRHLYLLAIEEDDELDGVDEWKQRAKKSSCPNHSLTINQPKHVGGDYELLPTHHLRQFTGPIIHHQSVSHKKYSHVTERLTLNTI